MQLLKIGGLTLWLAFSLIPGSTQAASSDRCQIDKLCRERVAAAIELGGKGRYEEALLLYESAYAQSNEPRLLLNIGRCHYRLNRAQKALDYYENFRRAQPDPEPDLASRLAQFVAEAKLALISQKASSSPSPTPTDLMPDNEPRPAPLLTEPETGRATVWGRPTWRVALGLSATGVGGVLLGLGLGALAANDSCVTPSMTFENMCATELRPDGQRRILLLDGVTPGIPLVVGGGLLLAGGIALFAWPPRPERGRASLRALSTSPGRAKP